MISADSLKSQLSNHYDKIELLSEGLFRCQKLYKDQPYLYYYFDFSSDLRELDIEEYSKKLLQGIFYSQTGILQWNYYLAFIIDSSIDPLIQRAIERNEDYARKFVVKYQNLEQWLNQVNGLETKNVSGPSQDLAETWRAILEKNNLDLVGSEKIPITEGVKSIINGSNSKQKSVSGKIKSGSNITDFGNLKCLDLVKFRKYPKGDEPFKFGKVNLIEGANGFGKTSLLESIEYLLSGDTARSASAKKKYLIRGNFENIEDVESCPKKFEILRERDKAWYGGVSAIKRTNLNKNFNKYSFFNTDAAFRMTTEKDQDATIQAFKDIALGEELNKLKSRIDKYKSSMVPELRIRTRDIENYKSEVVEAKGQLKQSADNDTSAQKLFQVAKKSIEKFEWNGVVPESVDSDLDLFYADLTEIKDVLDSVIEDVGYIHQLSRKSLSKERDSVKSTLESIGKVEKSIETAKNKIDVYEKQIKELEYLLEELEKLAPYHSKTIIKDIVGLNDRIETEIKTTTVLKEISSKYRKINVSPFVKEEMGIEQLLDSLSKKKEAQNKNTLELAAKIEGYENNLTDLQNIESQIKYYGLEYMKINTDTCECPMCQAKYGSSKELTARIEKIEKDLASSKILTDILSKHKKSTEASEYLEEQINSLRNIKSILAMFSEISIPDNVSTSRTLEIIDKKLSRLDEHNERLSELKGMKEKYALEGYDEHEYKALLEFLLAKTDLKDISNESQFRKYVARVENELTKTRKEYNENEKNYKGHEENLRKLFQSSGHEIDEEVNKDILNDRISNIDYHSNQLRGEYILKIAAEANIRIVAKDVEKLRLALETIRNEKKKAIELSLISERAQKTIDVNEPKIGKLGTEKNRLEAALRVFSEISENHSDQEYFEKFISENQKEIQDTFLAIHSPNEFSKLSISSGNIQLIKDDSVKVGVNEISSGQRSALALAVFLALNNKLKNGPDMMMFDDPVSFTDDLNVLSFIDHLREKVLSNNKQVFFATANENVAFLFRKKFEILGEDFKRISLER